MLCRFHYSTYPELSKVANASKIRIGANLDLLLVSTLVICFLLIILRCPKWQLGAEDLRACSETSVNQLDLDVTPRAIFEDAELYIKKWTSFGSVSKK